MTSSQSVQVLTHMNSLEGLVASLSDYEWRDLLQLLSTRRFKVDIIGSSKMPLELLIWIFDYLPRTNAFTLQSVQ